MENFLNKYMHNILLIAEEQDKKDIVSIMNQA